MKKFTFIAALLICSAVFFPFGCRRGKAIAASISIPAVISIEPFILQANVCPSSMETIQTTRNSSDSIQQVICKDNKTGNIYLPNAGILGDRAKGSINALIDCGLKGDGITDDAPLMQACVNFYSGKHILLPKTSATPAGIDYFFGSAITFSGNGQWISGESSGYIGGTSIKWPVGTVGIIFSNSSCQGCKLSDLNIIGSSPFSGSSKNQCVVPSGMEGASVNVTGTSVDDGIQVGANFTKLTNLFVGGWGRHGIRFTGGDIGGTFADDADVNNVLVVGNRGDGIYGHGGDFNAGKFSGVAVYTSQFWGIHDSGFLGNTYLAPQVTSNNQDAGGAAGGTTAVNISRSSSVVTVSNFTAHGLVQGNVIVISGASDATYNGSWFVASIIDANTITFSNAAGTSATANARIATCTEAWVASGLDGGAYKAVGASQFGTWLNAYSEASQPPSKFAGNNVIIGGDFGAGFDTTQQNYHYTNNGFFGSGFTFRANDANHPNTQLSFAPIAGNSSIVSWFESFNGTENYRLTSSSASLQLADPRAGGGGFRLFSGGIAQVDGGGGSIRLNSFSGTDVQFGNGAGVFPATMKSNGSLLQTGIAFASLGTPSNGTFIYCPDCTIANPCAGAGTGAFAKRLNGIWICN